MVDSVERVFGEAMSELDTARKNVEWLAAKDISAKAADSLAEAQKHINRANRELEVALKGRR